MFMMDQEFKIKIRNTGTKYIKVRTPTKGFKIPRVILTSKLQINHSVLYTQSDYIISNATRRKVFLALTGFPMAYTF